MELLPRPRQLLQPQVRSSWPQISPENLLTPNQHNVSKRPGTLFFLGLTDNVDRLTIQSSTMTATAITDPTVLAELQQFDKRILELREAKQRIIKREESKRFYLRHRDEACAARKKRYQDIRGLTYECPCCHKQVQAVTRRIHEQTKRFTRWLTAQSVSTTPASPTSTQGSDVGDVSSDD